MNIPDQTIELVKKWLDNPESIGKEERKHAAARAFAAYAAYADNDADGAKFWVNKYEELAQKE
jgi:hypothetical protein